MAKNKVVDLYLYLFLHLYSESYFLLATVIVLAGKQESKAGSFAWVAVFVRRFMGFWAVQLSFHISRIDTSVCKAAEAHIVDSNVIL